ncbi:MAG TPA: nickel-binding protein [Solirubrobacterales bacterium]
MSMEMYAIRRRGCWRSPEETREAGERSTRVAEEMSDDVRWIRSYVLEEADGMIGSICIYRASSPEAIREHGSRAHVPVDEVTQVGDTVIVNADPQDAVA